MSPLHARASAPLAQAMKGLGGGGGGQGGGEGGGRKRRQPVQRTRSAE